MLKKSFQGLALFVFFFAMGFYVLHLSSVDSQVNRDPAAIGKIYDFSNLKDEMLHTAVKQRLVSGIQLFKNSGDQGIAFGHYVFVGHDGEKKFACQEFNKVVVTFVAEGTAVSGEATKMEVEGPCTYADDVTKINPIWIPVSRILAEKAGDGDFQYSDHKDVNIRFSSIVDQWPKLWILQSVELKKSNSNESLRIQSDEINRYLGRPLVLKF